jgi:hypothetical protein
VPSASFFWPMHSGRRPMGSRTPYSASLVSATNEYAPSQSRMKALMRATHAGHSGSRGGITPVAAASGEMGDPEPDAADPCGDMAARLVSSTLLLRRRSSFSSVCASATSCGRASICGAVRKGGGWVGER